MKKLTILVYLLFYLSIVYNGIHAQEVICASGNYTENESGSICWTLGELVTETYTSENHIITQGFQQVNSIIIGVGEFKPLGFGISVFPNPTTSLITLRINEKEIKPGSISYHLYNSYGVSISQNEILENEMSISIKNRPPGMYYLVVVIDKEIIKSFKIIKH